MCTLCQTDWNEDITTKKEIFREAELLHFDNEQLADEVLGRTHGEEEETENELTPDLFGVPQTPNGSVDIDLIREEIGIGHSDHPEVLPASDGGATSADHGGVLPSQASNFKQRQERRKSTIMLQIG